MLKSKRIEHQLWDWIKCETFWVAGGCRHSGNCCNHLMIMVDGHAVNTRTDFHHHVSTKPSHTMFKPTYRNDSDQIAYFSCSKLGPQSLCQDYDNRPQMCRNYPASNFLLGSSLYQGCGFVVAFKERVPRVTNKHLLQRIMSVNAASYWSH